MKFISWTRPIAFVSLCFMACSSLSAQSIGFSSQSTTGNTIGAATPNKPVHVYYSDPVKGTKNGDGSAARPWGSLSSMISQGLINGQDNTTGVVHAGDLVYLLSGDHGTIYLDNYHGKFVNTDFITIQAAPNNVPVIDQIIASNVSKWVFRGITISQLNPLGGQYFFLVRVSGSKNMIFDSNTVCSIADASKWTPANWASLAVFSGMSFDCTSATITNNVVKNVENGISISGDGIILKSNVVDSFANDGIDFTASNAIIQNNSVTNHYGQWNDGYHHDGMQGWTNNGLITNNVLIDSNIIMASTGAYPTIPPEPTGAGNDYLQGLSIFDGTWNNLTITNNLVVACAYHGLSMYGISNSVIANNTVINESSDPNAATWLGVFAHSGLPISNVIVRNNIANNFQLSSQGVIDDHNIALTGNNVWSNAKTETIVTDPTKIFVKYQKPTAGYDFHLISGSPAIGAGTSTYAPKLDITGKTRNTRRMDIGAYSY